MNKTLKFSPDLVPLVLSGEKYATWRLWDDKDLSEGDILVLYERGIDQPFATAHITKTITKPLGELSEEDKLGHEKFSNDEEMYNTYKSYYQKEVGPETLVKIIWFQLTK